MDKIAIIGASYLQYPIIKKAKEMGFETHVFAWRDGATGFEYIDKFYPISIREIDKIYKFCKKIKPKAVVSIASDLANITVNEVARRLGLACNSEESVRVSTNKYEMRKALKIGGVSCPNFIVTDTATNIRQRLSHFSFPIIVKPTDRSGSRSITKLESFNGIEDAVDASINNSFEGKAIIEEYIQGDEYSFESITFNGEHFPLAITKKFTTGAPHFIETGHVEPAGFDEEQIKKITNQIKKALTVLKIHTGASHTEFKVDKEYNVKIIEIGARMGGDFIGADLVKLSTNQDFVKYVIDTSLGQRPQFLPFENNVAGIKYIFDKNDYEYVKNYIEMNHQKLIRFDMQSEDFSRQVVDSGSRLGYAIFKFDNFEEAKNFMEKKII